MRQRTRSLNNSSHLDGRAGVDADGRPAGHGRGWARGAGRQGRPSSRAEQGGARRLRVFL